jgi:hypothetical protein
MVRALLADLQIRVMEAREQEAQVQPLPKGLGNLIMQRFGIPAGPEVGRLRDLLATAVLEGRLPANDDPELYLRHLATILPDPAADDD